VSPRAQLVLLITDNASSSEVYLSEVSIVQHALYRLVLKLTCTTCYYARLIFHYYKVVHQVQWAIKQAY